MAGHGIQMPPQQSDAAFEEFYPSGLPVPVGFYTNPPPQRDALFPTERGKGPFRYVPHPLPPRSGYIWGPRDIQSVCNSLRMKYWSYMKMMVAPTGYQTLFVWFDPYDLYSYGVTNLWNVINHLVWENRIISKQAERERLIDLGFWVDSWLTDEDNKTKLLAWTEDGPPAFQLLSTSDLERLGSINECVTYHISSALTCRRALMLYGSEGYTLTDLTTAVDTSSLHNWLGKFMHNLLLMEKVLP